jgi:hypothetical protein
MLKPVSKGDDVCDGEKTCYWASFGIAHKVVCLHWSQGVIPYHLDPLLW